MIIKELYNKMQNKIFSKMYRKMFKYQRNYVNQQRINKYIHKSKYNNPKV